MPRIWVIHGPNLNLLGRRQPELYGSTSLQAIDCRLAQLAREGGHELCAFQSNHEGELVTWVQQAEGRADLLLLNPGGYTHTSVALRDAVLASPVPAIEVHLTNPYRREAFRRRSLIADVVVARVMGFGPHSYELALQGGLQLLADSSSQHGSQDGSAAPAGGRSPGDP